MTETLVLELPASDNKAKDLYSGLTDIDIKMKHYSNKDLESFVDGFIRASNILRSEKPNYLLAPITGAIPFVDALSIVDRRFDYNSVQYVPSTSKFNNLIDLMAGWYTGFLESVYKEEPMKIVSIDEVVGGSSVVRSFDAFKKAVSNTAKRTTKEINGGAEDLKQLVKDINKNIKYLSIGIVAEDKCKTRENKEYQRLLSKHKVIEVPVDRIITMDHEPLCPLKFKFSHKNGKERSLFKPEIESFEVSPEYIQFLQDVARYVGVDPSTVSPVNVSKINNFRDFIPKRFLEERDKEI